MSKVLKLVVVVVALGISAAAQSMDISLTAGVYHPVNNGFSTSNALALQGNIGARVASVPFFALYLEFPITGTLNSKVPLSALSSAGTYSSLFVTPGVRLKFAPGSFLSPYLATGGGLAHFGRSSTQVPVGSNNNSVNKAVWDIGGGVDLRLVPHVGVRGEVRDFYSGSPELRLSQITGTFGQRQHNIIFTAGLVLRF